jgi:Ni/Co efflux regulator RcnB
MHLDRIRHVAQIRGDAYFNAFGMKTESDGIDRVVRDGEALNHDIAHDPARTRLKALDWRSGHVVPVDERRRQSRNEDRKRFAALFPPADQARQPGNVIGVLVSNENGVKIFQLLADPGEPPSQFANTETRIDQNARLRSGKECRITGTAARECAKSDQKTKLPCSVLICPVLAQKAIGHE